MAKQEKLRFTATEYLRMERASETKHEFSFGEIYAVSRASAPHVSIVTNLVGELSNRLRRFPAHVYGTNLRLCVDATKRYTYPDVMVVCDKPQFFDAQLDTLLNPDLIVEVLSESTEGYDRGDKFTHYKSIPSCREYLLVAQHRSHITQYVKQDEGSWRYSEVNEMAARLHLPSVDCLLELHEVYQDITFPTEPLPNIQWPS